MDEQHFFRKNLQHIKKLIGIAHGNEQLQQCEIFHKNDFREFWQHLETMEEVLQIYNADLNDFAEKPGETLNKAEHNGISLDDFFTDRDFNLLEHCLTSCEGCLKALIDERNRQNDIATVWQELEDNYPISDQTLQEGLPAVMGITPPLLFAAAPEESPKPAGFEGQATGLLVCTSQGEKRASAVECSAWVSKVATEKLELELNGCNVDRCGDIETTEAIDEYLYRKLKKIFENNYLLQAFQLHRRVVVIDLTDEYIFEKADSLALAAVMAAVYAITEFEEPLPTAYSARLSINGKLLKVGKVAQKLEAAKQQGIKRVVLPEANRKDCPKEFLTPGNFQVLFFKNLSELFAEYGIAIGSHDRLEASGKQDLENFSEEKSCQPSGDYTQNISYQTRDILIKRFIKLGLEHDLANRLLPLLEYLLHAQNENFSTAFFIGDTEKINHFLPSSGMEINRKQTIDKLVESYGNCDHNLFSLANGKELGLVVSRDGMVTSLRRINVATTDRDDIAPLLMGDSHHFAVLSQLSDSTVAYFPANCRQIFLFAEGELFGRYFQGHWAQVDYQALDEMIHQVTENHNIACSIIEKTIRVAIALSTSEQQGTFFFHPGPTAKRTNWFYPLTDNAGLQIDNLTIENLDEDELINIASGNGIVLLDYEGQIINIHAYYLPNSDTIVTNCLNKGYPNRETATIFCHDTGGIAIHTDQNGLVGISINNNQQNSCNTF